MGQQIHEIMTKDLYMVPVDATLQEAALLMRDRNVGDVLVVERDGTLCGILTDRDIVVRGVAEGKPLRALTGEICSGRLVTVSPTDDVDSVVEILRKNAIRRVPVVRDGEPVGIVSLGDLARAKEPRSALGSISAAPPKV
jgi:CBS domain-containing protein